MAILLCDYRSQFRRYQLDPVTGEVSLTKCDTHAEAQKNTRGFGIMKSTGLLSKTAEFFALYTIDHRIMLYAAKGTFDLNDNSIEIKRYSPFLFIKCFSIFVKGVLAHSWLYWYSDLREDHFSINDFFLYVTLKISTDKEKETFIYFWEEVNKGRDPEHASFQNDLQEFLRQKFEP
jgi:hypothetical protein